MNFQVKAGHAAVVYNKLTGMRMQSYDQGFHFKIPFIEIPTVYSLRTLKYTCESTTANKGFYFAYI